MAFHGIYDHTLDSKNRLTVPSRSRSQLAGGVTVSRGFERCLQVWRTEDHEQLVERALSGLNPFEPKARDLNRFLYGETTQQELDSAGRISISPRQAEYAGITKAVKVVGSGTYYELWDEDTWEQHNADLADRAADHIASLGRPA